MAATNKRLLISESRGDSNRCTPYTKKSDQHITLFMLDLHRVPDPTSHVVHVGNLSLVPTRTKEAPTPGRSLGNRRHTGPAVVLGHLIPLPHDSIPLPHDSLGVGERSFNQVVTQPHQLTGSISPSCDRYVQYLLTGTNPSILNRHR
jgi:hypothetical protein